MTSPADYEELRLRGLWATGASVTGSNPALDEICQEARRHFEVPVSLVTLVDRQELRVKATQGLTISGLPRDTAFCAYTILSDDVFIIPDMLADERFKGNPLVSGEPHLRFYAGAPLVYQKGVRLGALCILDGKPHTFSRGDKAELKEMADRVTTEIATQELRALDPLTHRSKHG